MNENNRAILEMLEQGKISEEEAARLLDALEAQAEAGEEAPASQDESSSEPVPAGQEDGCSVVLNLGEGMRINVDSRDGVLVLDQEANGKVFVPTPPVPPVPPVPPTPPAPPAMPAMPPAPVPPPPGDPEALERYNEEVERFQEECQKLMEWHQEQVDEHCRRLEERQEQYQEQMDAYRQRLEERHERHREQMKSYHQRLGQPGQEAQAQWTGGFLTEEEYSHAYSQAYEKVYSAGYPEVEELGPGTPEGQSRLSELCEQAAQAAEEAVRQAQEEKQQNAQPGGDWQDRTRCWGARLGDIGAEIRRAMQGLGAQISDEVQEAMEDLQDAMSEVQDSLGEVAEAWQEWAEEEEDDDDDEDFSFDGEDEDEDEGDAGGLDDGSPQPAQAAQTADGWYVNTSNCGLSSLDKLDINWISGSVEIAPWDGDYVEVSERSRKPLEERQKMRVYVSHARELTVQFTSQQNNYGGVLGKGWNIDGFMMSGKHLTVKIPRDLCGRVEALKIHSMSASVSVAELTGESFTVDTVSGAVHASALHAEQMKLHSVSGRVDATGSSAEKLQLSSVSGVVAGSGLAAEKAKFSSVSGAVLVHANAESFEVSSTSGKVELRVDQCPEKARLTSVSGKVSMVMPENDGFTVGYKSASGGFSSDFPLTGSLGKKKGKGIYGNGATALTMHTTSGSMSIVKAR